MKQLGTRQKLSWGERGKLVKLKVFAPADIGGIRSKAHATAALQKSLEQLAELQGKLYAQDQWAVLVIFQGMDASGKDSVIKHVMAGVETTGGQGQCVQRPSRDEEQAG